MAESPYNGEHGTKRTISAYFAKLEKEGVDVKALWASTDRAIVKTMCAMQPMLAASYRGHFGPENKGRACFQVLGFDFLIDTQLQPWLLEINNNPDWSISHQQVTSLPSEPDPLVPYPYPDSDPNPILIGDLFRNEPQSELRTRYHGQTDGNSEVLTLNLTLTLTSLSP